jgi:hypothetical protein
VVGVDDNGVGVQQEERFRREIMSRLILKRWGWLACEAGQKGSGDVYQALFVEDEPESEVWGE